MLLTFRKQCRLYHWLPLVMILLWLSSMVNAQTANQKYKINDIRIEGNVRADTALVLLNSGLIRGTYVSADDIQRAIKNLWALGLFSDVQVYSEGQSTAGLDVLIRLDEFPRLESWLIEGNKKFKKNDIDKDIGFYRSMIYTPFKQYNARRQLINKYQEDGFLLVSVKFDTVRSADNSVIVKLVVDEGKKVQVKRIQAFGTGKLKNDELKGAFDEIKEKRWWRGADFKREKYEKDLENILAFCRKKGYRDAEIVRDSIYYSEDKRDLFIDVHVDEGQQYYFGDVTFEGNTIFPEHSLSDQLLFKKGDVYNQEDFDKSIRENLQTLYHNQGYLFATVQPLEIPVSEDTVDVTIRINEGHIVRIKEIKIVGNTKTNEKVIRREFKIYPGDTFNRALLERSVRDVWILNYFANVVPDVRLLPNDDQHVNLVVDIEERSTDTANMSAGYSERDKFIGSIGFSLNNFSLKRPLSGGDGQRLSFQWDFGRFYRNLSLSFIEPWAFGSSTLLGFSVFDTRFSGSFRPWDGRETGGTLQAGRRFRWPDNYFRGDWILRVAENELFNFRNADLEARFGEDVKSTQVSITQILRRDSRNRPEFPTFGSVYNLRSKLAGVGLVGDEHFLKNVFTLEWYVPVKWGFVLMFESQYGAIAGLEKDFYINPNERFFMGGSGLGFSESLRGYDDGDVGPVDENNRSLGGNYMARFTTELRFPIAPNPTIFGLFFAESGNVWQQLDEMDLTGMRRSAGVGLRLFMPLLGIIGFDLGYGFDYFDPVTGKRNGDWKVHFKFGQF